MNKMKITVFADPVCTWCWGSVPVLRALRYRFGEQLEFDYVMGGMVEDIVEYGKRELASGKDIAVANREIHRHWLDASAVHGMPVCESGFRLFGEDRRSSLPLNYAYLAAKVYVRENSLIVPAETHLRFLRRLQEATAVDALVTTDAVNIFDLSATVGFSPEKFRDIYHSETVRRLYEEGKVLCRKYDVQGFPTYRLEYRGKEMFLRGYSTFDILLNAVEELSSGDIKPLDDGREVPTMGNVRSFMESCRNAYPVEIATAFSLKRHSGHTPINVESYEGLPDIMSELVENGFAAMVPRGNGFMLYLLNNDNKMKEERRLLAGIL
ncbi:MAG: DsbA family protein [Bacteroidaceae bacterium]|nr:DsbA family protein [Bacteroidaceae bacterium]